MKQGAVGVGRSPTGRQRASNGRRRGPGSGFVRSGADDGADGPVDGELVNGESAREKGSSSSTGPSAPLSVEPRRSLYLAVRTLTDDRARSLPAEPFLLVDHHSCA